MQLSKRLKAVADFVTPGYAVADIGCDHAYVSIYLVEQQITSKVIAMDVNQGPLDRAKENIIKYGYDDKIETRKSNGVQRLEVGEVDTLLIAGMGGMLMKQILSERVEMLQSIHELVLQPQSDIHIVRHTLQEYGFLIIDENMLIDEGKYYVCMKAHKIEMIENPNAFELSQEEEFYFGKCLLEKRNPILLEYLYKEKKQLEGIYATLLEISTEQSLIRQKEMSETMERLTKGICYFKK